MNAHEQPNFLYTLRKRCGIVLFCLLAAIVTGLCATGWADSLFTAAEADDAAIILGLEQETPPKDVSSQILYVSNGSRGYDITLREGAAVTIRRGDSLLNVQSRGETISALLSRLRIQPAPLELIGVKLTKSGAELNVSADLTYYDYVTEEAAFTTQRVANPDLPQGEERVIQEGRDGLRSVIYEVVWSNGGEQSRRFVEELHTTASDQIVEYGTAEPAPEPAAPSGGVPAEYGETGGGIASVSENADGSGTLYLRDGTALNYSSARSMTATAYTTGYDGVGTITASGTAVHVGSVAVDKSVIPLGTRVYITVSGGSIVYGLAVAEDTGVKGSIIDLYYNTYDECIQFGRRPCTVYILE